jgi:hypothetical protein
MVLRRLADGKVLDPVGIDVEHGEPRGRLAAMEASSATQRHRFSRARRSPPGARGSEGVKRPADVEDGASCGQRPHFPVGDVGALGKRHAGGLLDQRKPLRGAPRVQKSPPARPFSLCTSARTMPSAPGFRIERGIVDQFR